ncbi:MAG TPA: bifunctional diguanylate cyclase/phosphodiesterase [Acidimicrobiales bacterium]|nr:bifunctional diguanylate cyclase/phosphodiesterase [Acidimicrobiales bacterium]
MQQDESDEGSTGSRKPENGGVAPEIRALADRTSSALVILDAEGVIRYANPAAAWLIGRVPDGLEGVDLRTLVHEDDRAQVEQDLTDFVAGRNLGEAVEYRIRAGDGTVRTLAAVASNLLDVPSTAGILMSATDVTEQRAYEQLLEDLALRDSTTGLPNQRALRERLGAEMSTVQPVAVAFIDLDHFKRINDSLGHTVGDAVLRTVGQQLAIFLPNESFVAHFGADTFVVIITGVGAERSIRLVWEMVTRLSNPMFVDSHELRLTATAGVAVRKSASTSESLLRDADAALTRARSGRRGGVEVFSEDLRTEVVRRLTLETELRHAVDRGQLELRFQPVVHLSTNQVEGNEALVRWIKPDGTPVSPSTFISLAEETGLIFPIGSWVLNEAVAALGKGRSPGLSINLSPRQLLDPGLPSRVERVLSAGQVEAERVAFEITETVVIENFELATQSLTALRNLGCLVGLDDFGTGHSSFGYLRRLPVDFLKLDRELVGDIDTDPQAARITEAVVGLAASLSLATVAEGVEREQQGAVLVDLGCEFGQGFLFGEPRPM